MDCRVVVEAAVPVYDVETADEAVRIAISKTGEMLNPDLNYVEISMGTKVCPNCGDEREPAFIAADEGLVALDLEMTVFNVERNEHAARIARKEIGQRLKNIPLEVEEVEVIETDDETEEAETTDEEATEAETPADETAEAETADEESTGEEATAEETADEQTTDGEAATEESDDVDAVRERPEGEATAVDDEVVIERDENGDVLPEFEDLIDE